MKNCRDLTSGSNRKLLAYLFLSVVSFTVAVVLLVIDPVPIIARKYTRISNGSFVVEFLKNKLESVHISMYLFNITNAEEFMSGKDYKLKLEEVGPFTYRETIIIENFELDEEAGVMRYSPRYEPEYVLEESIGRPEDFNITTPNLALLGLSSIISSYPFFVRMAFNVLVRKEKYKPLLTVDAKSYMWGTPDPFFKLIKSIVPGLVTYDKLGMFDQFYNLQTKNELVVGATEKDKFAIKTRNGHKKLTVSQLQDAEMCNRCENFENVYEGMMYPSPVHPEMPIKIFRSGFCKLVGYVFHEKRVLENSVEGFDFHINSSFFGGSSIYGLVDLRYCLHGFPLYISKTHFQDVDPVFYDRIDGMKPDPDKYKNYITIEPITGVQLDTQASIQMNLLLSDLSFNSETRRFSNMLIPTCYSILKQPELPEIISLVLRILYVTLPIALLIIRLTMFLVTFVLIAYCVRLLYWKHSSKNMNTFPNSANDEKSRELMVQEPLIANSNTNFNKKSP